MKYDEVDILGLEPKEIMGLLLKDVSTNVEHHQFGQAGWLETNIPQTVLKAAYLTLYNALEPIHQLEDEFTDWLRDNLDILWFALSNQSQNEIEESL